MFYCSICADDWELPRHRLIVYTDAKLGAGAFGSVYKGKPCQFPGSLVQCSYSGKILGVAPAAKHYGQGKLPKYKLEDVAVAIKSLPEYADEGAKSDFLQEINFMKSLGYNDHIVCLMGCVTLDQPLSLLLEHCSDGDLLHFLRSFKKVYCHCAARYCVQISLMSMKLQNGSLISPSLKELLSFAWQICDGMVCMSYVVDDFHILTLLF